MLLESRCTHAERARIIFTATFLRLRTLNILPRAADFTPRRADLLTVARLRLALAHRFEAGLYPASRLP